MRGKEIARRTLLKLAAIGSAGIAGCQTNDTSSTTTQEGVTIFVTQTDEPSTISNSSTTIDSPTHSPSLVPPELVIRELTVSPKDLAQFDTVSIKIDLENIGEQRGDFNVELLLDGESEITRSVTIAPGKNTQVDLSLEVMEAGSHEVKIGENSASFTVQETFFVADTRENVFSYWERLLFTCLQGIANRTTPRILLYHTPDPRYNPEWLDWYSESIEKPIRTLEDPYRLFELSWPIEGYAIVDRWNPDSANIAATYAATEKILPITEEIQSRTDVPDFDVKYDLRDRFTNESKADIYRWALDTQWSSTNSNLICKKPTPVPLKIDISEYTGDSNNIYLRFEDPTESDGLGTSLAALRVSSDDETEIEIIPNTPEEFQYIYLDNRSWIWKERRRIADKNQFWIYEIDNIEGPELLELYIKHEYLVKISTNPDGPYDEIARGPREEGIQHLAFDNTIRDYVVSEEGMFVDLASGNGETAETELFEEYLGEMTGQKRVFGWHTPRGSEHDHVYQISSSGGLVVPTPNAPNFSVHKHMGEKGPFKQSSKVNEDSVSVDENSVYVTFVMSDGDAPGALSQFLYGNWLDEMRGEVPIGWEIQPLLTDIAPGMIEYFYEHATENDTFVASASGIGYTFPDAMTLESLRTHLQRSRPYFEETDLSTLTVLHHRAIEDSVAERFAYELGSTLTGVMEGYWDRGGYDRTFDRFSWLKTELPDNGRFSIEQIVDDFNQIAANTTKRPYFIPTHIPTTQNLTTSDVVEIANQLDSKKFTVVPPDEFFIAHNRST